MTADTLADAVTRELAYWQAHIRYLEAKLKKAGWRSPFVDEVTRARLMEAKRAYSFLSTIVDGGRQL